jgi:dissimilatory sulfite reductase (desulfoviridin) alpha/beta subunit
MVRVRIPDGRLTASQYLALDALADRHANGSLRITTRHSIQFHSVVKAGLKLAQARDRRGERRIADDARRLRRSRPHRDDDFGAAP